jgi:hypothetical protein
MEIFFPERQEGARRAVERLFGVPFKKWAILHRPSRLWHVEDMEIILEARIILRNMSCEERRETFHRVEGGANDAGHQRAGRGRRYSDYFTARRSLEPG